MDFYYGIASGNSARVAFALIEAGVSYTPHAVDVPRGESRTPEYLALNPMGKVPALVDGPLRLWESNAINWYVAEAHASRRLLPATVQGRASAQRWLFFQAGHVTPACAKLFRATNPHVRAFWGTKPDADAAEAARRELSRYLPVLEQALTDRDFLERELSLADLAYAPHLWLVAEGGYDFASTPRVRAWLERLLARPAWAEARRMVFRR
ncbi:MAG TPA: glutathione S-transferase family protein [Polyangiaceae bacterium]|nr:glutathione S-transferase family protein [Polyangiaceae bacterium]